MKLAAAQRRIAAELAIGLAICGAAYYFLVQPLKKELLSVRAKSAAMLANSPVTTLPDPSKIEGLMQSLREKVGRIEAGGELARSEASMFARVSELSRRFDIRVDELRTVNKSPIRVTAAPPAGAGAPPSAPQPPGEPIGSQVQYEFTARGSYPNIAAFLNAFNTEMGYAVLRFVRVTPAGDDNAAGLTVVVKSDHLDFNTAPIHALIAPSKTPPTPVASGGTAP